VGDHAQALDMYRKSFDWKQAVASSRLLGYNEAEFTKLIQDLFSKFRDDRKGQVFELSLSRRLKRFRAPESYLIFHLELVGLKDHSCHSDAAFLQLFYANVRLFE
jgi:hypothetical protein